MGYKSWRLEILGLLKEFYIRLLSNMAIRKRKRICWNDNNTIHGCYDIPCGCATYSNYIEIEPLDINRKIYTIYRYDDNKIVLKCICHDETINNMIHYHTNGKMAVLANFINGKCDDRRIFLVGKV